MSQEMVQPGEVDRLLSVIEIQNALAAAALDAAEIAQVVVERARELVGADAGVVELREGDEMVYTAAAGTAAEHVGLRLQVAASLSGLCARTGEMQRCDDARTDPRADRETAMAVGAISMLCVPLADAAGIAGVLKVYSARANAFDEADALILTQLSAVIASHMRRAEEYERRAFESRHDVLTDVGNRRAYEERLATEVARATRYDQRLSVVLLDLDGFKPVNDRFGHPEGDEVLRRVGATLRSVRAADDCFRIGGDEFALVLPETDADGAGVVTGRVRDAIADAAARWSVTATAGFAPYSGGDWSDLHATADAALVAAKRGR